MGHANHSSILRLARFRPGLSWFTLAASTLAIAGIVLGWSVGALAEHTTPDARVYLLSGVAGGLVGSALVFASRRVTLVRSTLLVRLALVMLIARADSIGLLPVILLATALVLEMGISEEYPANLIAGLTATVFIALAYQNASTETASVHGVMFERVGLLIIGGSCATVFSLATRYREDLIREQRHSDRLDAALERLSEANIGYQEYASRAEQASMLEERKRITREIHDTIGYTMTNNIMMMEAAAEMVRRDPDGVERLMEKARASAQEGLDEIRNALHLLRAQESPAPSSTDAIVKMIAAFRDATGTEVELELGNTPIRLNPEIESAVYHSVREALTNSFRHGKATRVRVQFWKSDSELTVVVWDNGVGGGDEIHEGIGLSGMRERLRAVSGTLRIGPLPTGFQVVATIPEPGGSHRR